LVAGDAQCAVGNDAPVRIHRDESCVIVNHCIT
jgi:hypothetical protein